LRFGYLRSQNNSSLPVKIEESQSPCSRGMKLRRSLNNKTRVILPHEFASGTGWKHTTINTLLKDSKLRGRERCARQQCRETRPISKSVSLVGGSYCCRTLKKHYSFNYRRFRVPSLLNYLLSNSNHRLPPPCPRP
jgi:hypothetical protein